MFEIIEVPDMPKEVREIYDTLEVIKDRRPEYLEYLFHIGIKHGILFPADRAWYFQFSR